MFIGGVRSVIMIFAGNAKDIKKLNVLLVIYFSTRTSINIHTLVAKYALNKDLNKDGIANAILIYAFNVLINDFDV